MAVAVFPSALKIQLKLSERNHMTDRSDAVSCADDTQKITIHLPRRLAERVDKYAKEDGNTVTGVVIEALDALMRGRKVV